MPRFDFQCTRCGNTFEGTIPFGAKKLPKCTACGERTEKLIAPPAIHFKGSGFYVTDKAAAKQEKKEEKSQTAKIPAAKPAKKIDPPATKQ